MSVASRRWLVWRCCCDATVLVVGEDKKATLRVVETGPAVGNQWEVTRGLKAGEQVIVDGLQNIRPGVAVRPEVIVNGVLNVRPGTEGRPALDHGIAVAK
jgi:hypothetical protein